MNLQHRLPPAFTNLYRLFLRTSSASVLHQRRATLNLRRRWRPVFDTAAQVTRELNLSPDDAPADWRREREAWLKSWNRRIDNTLALLYNSASTRGLPHQVSRNLGHVVGLERQDAIRKLSKLPKWNSHEQTPKPPSSKLLKKDVAKAKEEWFNKNAAAALEDVIRMAEATAGLTLGRSNNAIRRWPSRL